MMNEEEDDELLTEFTSRNITALPPVTYTDSINLFTPPYIKNLIDKDKLIKLLQTI